MSVLDEFDKQVWREGQFPPGYPHSRREYYELEAKLKDDGRRYGEAQKADLAHPIEIKEDERCSTQSFLT